MPAQTDDLRVKGYTRLISPREMKETIPVSEAAGRTVIAARDTIGDIIFKVEQRVAGNDCLVGLMLESHLFEGNQKLGRAPSTLEYGVSITDECISWKTTEALVLWAAEKMASII